MKPESFTYLQPETTQDALKFLDEYGYEASIIAGGQSLIPMLNMRLAAPKYLIDLGCLEDLEYINVVDNKIEIGALTKQRDVESFSIIKAKCPLLHEAVKLIGNIQIRNRGTVGGSIAHADPSAELPCVLSALRGSIVIASIDEEKVIPAKEFFLSYLLTALEPMEMIKAIQFPIISSTTGYSFLQKSRRHGDFALAGVATLIDLDDYGNISSAKIATCGVDSIPSVLEEVELFLIGNKPSNNLFEESARIVKTLIDPESDIHGSKSYRQQLVSVLTKRSLKIACKRATRGDKFE